MKVNGKILSGPRIVKVYLPTGDSGAVEFSFRPLRSDEKFADVYPKPTPPTVIQPGGVSSLNTDDSGYKSAMAVYQDRKFDWEFLKSISATDGLEWSEVKEGDPSTWCKWKDEITAHFSEGAANYLTNSFVDAQYITEESLEKARAAFLTGVR